MTAYRIGVCAGLVLAFASHVAAQTALTGGVQGSVRDAQGRAVRATAVLTHAGLHVKQTTETDAAGEFRFVRLVPADSYEVRVTAPGLQEWRQAGLLVVSGELVTIAATLGVEGRQEAVTVSATAPLLATDSTELATVVDQRRLNRLPNNGRFLNRFALLNSQVRNTSGLGGDGSSLTRLSVNGAIFRETQYRLDGNSNYDTLFNNAPLQRLSLSAVSEFRVLTNQFNAEHGSTSTGLVIATTRSGTSEWHGEALVYARPSGPQARSPLANRRVPNQLVQGGASVGGPLVADRTFLFANYERLVQERGSFVTSPQPALYVGAFDDHVALARIDHRFTDAHWSALRLNGQRETNTNSNDRVGGLLQPNAATLSKAQTIGAQWTDTLTRARWVNEWRAGYVNAVPSNTVPVNAQVGVVRPGYSTEGTSSFTMIRTEVYQAANQLSWTVGRHNLKAGGDLIRRKVRDFSYDLFGTFTFAAGAPTPGQVPLQYSQRFGVARISYGQTQWAGFVQDTWRALPRLTLNMGLRYDHQSILDDGNNLGPRFGFAWDTTGDARLVVRGGFGLFYDQPFFHGLTQRFLLNGLTVPFATVTLTPADAAFPTFPNSLAPTALLPGLALAPRNVVLRGERLLSPYTTQVTTGVQGRVGEWVLSMDLIRSLTVKQFVHYDRNAPAPFVRTMPGQVRTVAEADRTRPLYDPVRGASLLQGVPVRQVRETVNGGSATVHAATLGLTRRWSGRYQVALHYTLSSAMNNVTDDHLGANPNEWSDVGRGEFGPSDFGQRHRFVGHGTMRLWGGVEASTVATLASALPINATTGVDNNGDTTLVDRPAGFGRNAFWGTPQRSLDVSVLKRISLGGERVTVEVRADAYNVTNHSNFHQFNRVWGNGAAPVATFARPLGGVANADPGRQFTAGARLVF